jgi:hypothetical protein
VWGVLEGPTFKSAWACCLGGAVGSVQRWRRRSAEAATLLVGPARLWLWLRPAGDRPELRVRRENILCVTAQTREPRTFRVLQRRLGSQEQLNSVCAHFVAQESVTMWNLESTIGLMKCRTFRTMRIQVSRGSAKNVDLVALGSTKKSK